MPLRYKSTMKPPRKKSMNFISQEWYTPADVVQHNRISDCWVSLDGKVLNLTKWLEATYEMCKCPKSCMCNSRLDRPVSCPPPCFEKCRCCRRGFACCDAMRLPAMVQAFAGKDVSHWFKGGEWTTFVHPVTGITVPFYRCGPPVFQPNVPSTAWRPIIPWWKDPTYVVGKLSAKTRPIRIVNTLTGSTVTLEVCSEESIYQIMMRYLPHNSHMMSYTWRCNNKTLMLDKTLDENGVVDTRINCDKLALPDNLYTPAILLYFNNDLTEDPPHKESTCNCDPCDCEC